MPLTFANFKQIIPSQILTRGRDYYRKKQIADLSFDEEDSVWEAQVEGTELYDVRVELEASSALTTSCTCPYDMGEHCKHVAAVLYAIEEAYPEFTAGKRRRAKTKSGPTRSEKLRNALVALDHDKLVEVLMEFAGKDKQFFSQLELRLGVTGSKPADYNRLVKDALRLGRGDYGYIDYRGSTRAARKLDELFVMAETLRREGDAERALAICQAVVENVIPVMNEADDSNGDLSASISQAVEEMRECAGQLGASARSSLLAFCLGQAQSGNITGFDLQYDLFDLAGDLVRTEADRTMLFDVLQAHADRSRSYGFSYARDYAADLMADVIERLDGEAAAMAYIQANIHVDAIRRRLIERYQKEGKTTAAKQLAEDGITLSRQKGLLGLVLDYQDLLLKTAQAEGDREAIIRHAEPLWLHSGREEYFNLLKQNVPAALWGGFLEKLRREVRTPEQMAWVYEREEMWNDLLALASNPGNEQVLEHHHRQLGAKFPTEMIALYERRVARLLDDGAGGRSVYQRIVEALRRIRDLGEPAKTKALVESIRARYPKRRALIDELNQL